MQNILFQPIKINNLELKNRFVMPAAADNLQNNPEMRIKRFAMLAEGGIGLIISGGTAFDEVGVWQNIVDVVHRNNAKIAIQLVGKEGIEKTGRGVSVLSEDSPVFNQYQKYCDHRALTDSEIMGVVASYAAMAVKAKSVGVDAIEIHAAHQSLPSQFLSPITNKRDDRWGGSLENRMRLHCEIFKAIRAEVGADFPIMIKLGVQDALKDGLLFSEGKIAAQMLTACGYDALEISQGLQDIGRVTSFGDWSGTPMRSKINKITDEGYFRSWCHEIKQSIVKPTILTGGLRSYELIANIVENSETDLVGLCRPLIREPNLINRWQGGDYRKANCVSCNKCITELLLKGLSLECYLDNK